MLQAKTNHWYVCYCAFSDIVKLLELLFMQVLLEHNLNSFLGPPFVVIIFE